MKKSFWTLMATVAILSSSPLLAMEEIQENIEVNNQKSTVHQLPITLNSEVANELNRNKFVRTTAGKFELSPLDDRLVASICKNKKECTLIPSFLFNENKKLLLQSIMDNDTINSIILEKSEKLELINPNAPILNFKFEEMKIEDNKKSIDIIEEVKKPIQIPQFLEPSTLKQILEDGYLNTTEGMFKFSGNNKELAQSIYTQLNQGYPYLIPGFSTHYGNELTFSFSEQSTQTQNPNWHPEFIANPNWIEGEPELIKNPLWNPNEPEFHYMPGMTYTFTLEKK
jgi:hypothetical protein